MKFTIQHPTEIDVATIELILPIRFGDEDMSYNFPLRQGDVWRATVDIDTGKIHDWPVGRSGKLYEKVVDGGTYALFNADGILVAQISDYVPHGVVPGDWGDYVDLKINEQGVITNWPTDPDVAEFFAP